MQVFSNQEIIDYIRDCYYSYYEEDYSIMATKAECSEEELKNIIINNEIPSVEIARAFGFLPTWKKV